MQEDMWRNLVNNMPELPNNGSDAPDIESIKQTPVEDGESPVYVQKIVTEVYVYNFLNGQDVKYGTQTFQNVHQLGNMRFSEALKIIEKSKKRRRR